MSGVGESDVEAAPRVPAIASQPERLPVSAYFVWQWWEEHYQKQYGRPDTIDLDWLDETWLGRQRFLRRYFGNLGIGSEAPVLDRAFLSKVMPFHAMIVAVALGMDVTIQDTGGYAWHPMSEGRLRTLRPADIARTRAGELILEHRRQRIEHYGTATQMIDLASVTNNAFMMRGPDFYVDLMVDRELANRYLGVLRETMCLAYKFISESFGPIEGVPLANCNVTMMSPQLYQQMIRRYDIECVEYAAKLTGEPACCDLHHCDVKTEPFAETYSRIPGLRSLQGSSHSNIREILRVLPGVRFSAMVNPVGLVNRPAAEVVRDIESCIVAGAHDLAIWDIDTTCGPRMMARFLRDVREAAARHGRAAEFSVIPLTWEEMAWEFPRYVTPG